MLRQIAGSSLARARQLIQSYGAVANLTTTLPGMRYRRIQMVTTLDSLCFSQFFKSGQLNVQVEPETPVLNGI